MNWRLFFEASDFNSEPLAPQDIADQANAKLWTILSTSEKVYGSSKDGHYHGQPTLWQVMQVPSTTHEGRIVDVRKVGPCNP
jgi:hypothetical protein